MMEKFQFLRIGNRVTTMKEAVPMAGTVVRIERETNIPGFWVRWMDGREQWLPFFALDSDVDFEA